MPLAGGEAGMNAPTRGVRRSAAHPAGGVEDRYSFTVTVTSIAVVVIESSA